MICLQLSFQSQTNSGGYDFFRQLSVILSHQTEAIAKPSSLMPKGELKGVLESDRASPANCATLVRVPFALRKGRIVAVLQWSPNCETKNTVLRYGTYA